MIGKKSIKLLTIFYVLFYTYPSMAESTGGMPQMVIPDFMPQLIWLFIIFPILYLTMKYMALPRISEIITNRDMKVINNLNKAEEIRNKIDELNKAHQLAVRKTNEEIELIVSEISQKSVIDAEHKMMQCQNDINSKIKKEKVTLQKELEGFNTNIEKIANDAATDIVEKIYYTKPNTNNLKNIISKHSESYKNDE